MIIPITKDGDVVGTARVVEGSEVEFYLRPGFTLRDDAKVSLVKQLKRLVRSVK